jgi:hypothetical protein
MAFRAGVPCVLIGALAAVLGGPALAQGLHAGRDRALDSVVQVVVHTRFGTVRRCSGYMYSANGYVVTAFHAVSDAEKITIVHASHGVFDVGRIRRLDRRTDVAVLGADLGQILQFSASRIGDPRLLVPGTDVRIMHHAAYRDQAEAAAVVVGLGYPRQLTPSAFTADYASEYLLLELRGPFDSGSAGGLVLSKDYEVLGIILGCSDPGPDGARTGYALATTYLPPLLNTTAEVPMDRLRTEATSDTGYFDKFMGPAAKPLDFQAPMTEGYVAWFAPIQPARYADAEFTSEINDKIDKNWFYTSDLVVDGRDIRDWSLSRLVVVRATTNPWGFTDGPEEYMHFDADSVFAKRIYKDRSTEERIMTRHVLALALPPGKHTLQYVNRGANYKISGVKRLRLDLASAEIHLLDIVGLSLVSMTLLPNPPPGVGEGEPVHYDLERHPYQEKELNWSIRQGRFVSSPQP